MATTQYIGARYVPIFAEPSEWSKDSAYEELTIVIHEGNSYTSKQSVPIGVDIANDKYWALTGNYNAQIEQYRKETKNAGDNAANALSLAQTNEQDIATLDSEMAGTADSGLKSLINDSLNIRGLQKAKYEIFTDDKAWANGDMSGESIWSYMDSIFNTSVDKTVHNAGSLVSWNRTNAAGQNAEAYLITEAKKQTENYRKTVDIVILNFGYYDVLQPNVSADYESIGRSIVNKASNYYPNALICVNPISATNCYTFERSNELHFYSLNYGMARSQVPCAIVPWYVAYTLNLGATNHYYDYGTHDNPYILNAGGTESVAASIKWALCGNPNAYIRNTRASLNGCLDNNYFTSVNGEFIFNSLTGECTLTAPDMTCVKVPENDTEVGSINSIFFQPPQDTILTQFIQHTTNNPMKGYLVLTVKNKLVWRTYSTDINVAAGAIVRGSSCSWMPVFHKQP